MNDSKPKPPYKTANNRWYTSALFWDRVMDMAAQERQDFKPVFTLYQDHPDYINARKTFVEMGDPTGYRWAIHYLGDYDHWTMLMKAKWFREAYEYWCEELNAKLLGEALDSIRQINRESDNDNIRLSASKYLAERPWDKKTKGRPSKSDVHKAAVHEAQKRTAEDDDLERIGLKVVNNAQR